MNFPILLATGNADKAREISEIFALESGRALAAAALDASDGVTIGFVLAPVDEIADALRQTRRPEVAPDVEETGSTLSENALIKAHGVGAAVSMAAIADDTGLEVDALDGAPGVFSARYAGLHATYADNCAKLVGALAGAPEPRVARFATVACCWRPDGSVTERVGTVEGRIVDTYRGTNGFGYDPIFVPDDGDGRTFAEMSASEKHVISHRGRAFRALAAALGGHASGPRTELSNPPRP